MRIANTAVVSVALLVAGAIGAEQEPSPEPLHFRLVVGIQSLLEIDGRLVASPGSTVGYDTVLLDLDGDGRPETRREIGETTHPRSGRKVRDVRVSVRHEDAIWTLELDALKSPEGARRLAAGTTRVHWSVSRGDLFVRFQESSLAMVDGDGAAEPFRMGPPLRFEAGSGTRGPNPTVTLALKDPNGGILGLVRRAGKTGRPEIRILSGKDPKVTAHPGYS